MGSGLAEVVATAGIDVVVRSRTQAGADAVLDKVAAGLARHVGKERMSEEERKKILGHITVTDHLGQLANCDLVIEGEGIHPLHARVTARGNGEFQIHGLAAQSADPYGDGGGEEWIVLHAGESIGLGDYQITISETEETELAESA